jgi:type II secretory pathway pseudopilin PulG
MIICQYKIFNMKKGHKGFTLVEMLASVVVLVAIGAVITGIISSSLRGNSKTNTIENIRQNGNYVLNQISKDIEYAQLFDGKNTGLKNKDEDDYETACPFSPSPTPVPVSTSYKLISIKSMNNKITQYRCTSYPPVLSANGISLINTDIVSLKSCSLTCVKSRLTDVPMIKISFVISSSGLVEKSSSITFENSIVMKNYRQ